MQLNSNEGPETGSEDNDDPVLAALGKLDEYDVLPTTDEACDADFFFSDLLDSFESDVDMDTFAELCEHIKNTYQALYSAKTRNDFFIVLQPYESLVRLSAASPINIDTIHDVILYLVDSTLNCIRHMSAKWPQPDKIMDMYNRRNVCYDFDKDTPEAVYDRIKAKV